MSIIKKHSILLIYSFAIIYCTILFSHCKIQWDYDTESYISAWENISTFHVDIWRTPVYPLFIGLTKKLFGSHFLIAGSIIQHLVFLTSIWYFYKIVIAVVKKKNIALFTTAFYSLYPCYATWNCYIITEPFAIYSMVFTLYCAIKAYQLNSTFHILSCGFWILFQVFLRPAQLYILPVFMVGWIILYTKEGKITKIIRIGVISILLITSMMLLYMLEFKKAYGIFTPCGVGVVNKYYMARRDGSLNTDNISDTIFKEFIKKNDIKFQKGEGTNIDLFKESQNAVYTFGLKTVSDVTSSSSTSFISDIKSIFYRFHNAANDKLFNSFLKRISYITDIIGFRINIVYYLLIIYLISIGYYWKKKHYLPWFSSLLLMLGSCHIIIIIIACQNIWSRLILPATPIYLIMLTQLFQSIYISSNKEQT